MQINEQTYEITTSQYDYGVPIVFEAGEEQGFQIGDKIIFVFDSDVIADKPFTVDESDYTLSLSLEKEEADALFAYNIVGYDWIRYSAKRYRDGQFLETLVDSRLKITGTVKWGGEQNG